MNSNERRICLTGGAGFLGSRVANRLANSKLTIPRSATCDLRKWENCLAVTKNQDIVIHLAANVGGIGKNQERPGELFYDNILMGAQLMEAARLNGVEKFVAVGTVCLYPKFCPVPFLEQNIWEGYPENTNAPYGLAKKMLLVQAQAYRQQYGFNSIYLIPTNLYGEGDNFEDDSSHVIPALIKKCIHAVNGNVGKIVVWGDGSATREFLYVDDCAEAIVLATEKYNGAEPVNIGSNSEISIMALVQMIAEYTGFRGEIIWDKSKPNGQPRRKLNIDRAKYLFGFESKTSFEEGLKRTIAWYKSTLVPEIAPMWSDASLWYPMR